MKTVIQVTLASIIVLLLMESFSRVLFTISSGGSPSADFLFQLGVESSPELGWQRIPSFSGRLSREPGAIQRRFDSSGFLLPDSPDVAAARVSSKDQGTRGASIPNSALASSGDQGDPPRRKTILTFGDSSTFGWGVPAEATFSEILDRMLPESRVINLGVVGYSSYQGYKSLVAHAPTLDPGLIIVSFNYNDRRHVLSENDFDSDEKFSRDAAGRTLNDVTSRIYAYRILHSVMRRVGIVGAPEISRPGRSDARAIEVRVPPEQYRENLRKFARFANERQIPLIFLVLGDNPAFTTDLRRGTALLEDGQYEQAIRTLTIAARLENPFSDIAKKQLAIALDKQGDAAAAKNAAEIDPQFSAAGGKPIYFDSDYHKIVREVGKEYNAKVVEAARALAQDPSMYVDFCHPDERGHGVIGTLLFESIKSVAGTL